MKILSWSVGLPIDMGDCGENKRILVAREVLSWGFVHFRDSRHESAPKIKQFKDTRKNENPHIFRIFQQHHRVGCVMKYSFA